MNNKNSKRLEEKKREKIKSRSTIAVRVIFVLVVTIILAISYFYRGNLGDVIENPVIVFGALSALIGVFAGMVQLFDFLRRDLKDIQSFSDDSLKKISNIEIEMYEKENERLRELTERLREEREMLLNNRDIDVERGEVKEWIVREPELTFYKEGSVSNRLDAYLSLNIKQINMIFYTSLIVMTIGFIMIIVAIILALINPIKTTPAIVAGVGGVITEFIGATFLIMYRSAIEHSGRYIQTLDKASSAEQAINILDNIGAQNEDEKRNIIEAKTEIAKLLLTMQKENTKK